MIRFYGHLRERSGEGFDLHAGSPAEGIRALCAVVPGFVEYFRPGRYTVLVGEEPQTIETVLNPSGGCDISIVPVVEGAKSELGQILLGGVSRMLAGSPQVGGPDDVANGSFFSGPENVATQGACIPIGYGEILIGSIVVSAGTSAEAYPCGANGGPLGGNPGTWTMAGNVWSNGGDGRTAPLWLGVDPS